MKKLLSTILLAVVLFCMLVSCSDDEPTIEVNADGYLVVNGVKTEYEVASDASDKIHYPLLNYGTKIESLPLTEQQKIDEYVADCKTVFSASLAVNLDTWNYDLQGDIYLSFTNTFVYDLTKVDESHLDETSSLMWNDIKALNGGESAPIMYIELSGFCSYLRYYRPTYFSETNMICGYFIFENETFKPMLYKQICNKYYDYIMIDGAEFIDCGNKYSEEKSMEELTYYYEAIQSGLTPENVLKRLTPIYK